MKLIFQFLCFLFFLINNYLRERKKREKEKKKKEKAELKKNVFECFKKIKEKLLYA